MDNYAPLTRSRSYDDPGYSKDYDIPNDPYNVDEHYYVDLVMKEWQACPSEVGKLYFSITNMKRLQKLIRREIYNRSYGKFRLVEDQNVLDLLHPMRAIYKTCAKDLPYKIVKQVKYLNKETVEYIAPDLMTNLIQHYGYLDDIKNPLNPILDPINVNQAGRNQLRGVAHVYGI